MSRYFKMGLETLNGLLTGKQALPLGLYALDMGALNGGARRIRIEAA